MTWLSPDSFPGPITAESSLGLVLTDLDVVDICQCDTNTQKISGKVNMYVFQTT